MLASGEDAAVGVDDAAKRLAMLPLPRPEIISFQPS